MYNYQTAFWILVICYPICMTISEAYWYNKGLKRGMNKGIKIGALQERIKHYNQPKNNQKYNTEYPNLSTTQHHNNPK